MKKERLTPERDDVLAVLSQFLSEHAETYGLEAMGCFGSVARCEANEDSDVDVVYRARPDAKLTLFDLSAIRNELVARLGRPVDLIELRESLPARLKARLERETAYV